ncbi:MAG: trypsin-like peptidase domain-containing protein [Chloroflexi bacterium]|nr:trypsin-like peptidase domain-containing protein [Chloroflexota bacterium]
MTTLLPQLNSDLGELADQVRRSLVQVSAGRSGSGSGVVFAADGLVVTNAHVVSGNRGRHPGTGLRVTLPNGVVAVAGLLAKDDDLDVAILQVERIEGKLPELHPIKMGDSRELRAGQWVMAMGHPWGVAGAAVAGIVIGAGPDLPEAPGAAKDWIAVDLALRPGHSGGPLVDHRGRLIGMSAMMAGLEVGMAVPVHVIGEFVARVLAGEAGAEKYDTAVV